MNISTGRRLVAVGAMMTLAGCGGNSLEGLGDILGGVLGTPAGTGASQVAVEIQGVNTQQQALQVRTQDGQTGAVRFDQNTIVVYREQQYPITALERGDLAVLHIQDAQGTTYVSRVDVTQSVRERTDNTGTGSVMQFSGRVSQIDQNNGRFVVQTQNGNVTISLPYNAPQATVNYFRQLRNGDTVRLEAVPLATGRAELYRFL